MKELATGTLTALLIAATTTLAMAQGHVRRGDIYNDRVASQSQEFGQSPASQNSGIEGQ
jgi:hypothetical protein